LDSREELGMQDDDEIDETKPAAGDGGSRGLEGMEVRLDVLLVSNSRGRE